MSCTPEAVVCEDAVTTTDAGALVAGTLAVAVLVVLLVLVLLLVRRSRAARRARRVTRVWVSADGDVVHRG